MDPLQSGNDGEEDSHCAEEEEEVDPRIQVSVVLFCFLNLIDQNVGKVTLTRV